MLLKTCKNFYLERQAHQKLYLLLRLHLQLKHNKISLRYKWKRHKIKKPCKRKPLILFNPLKRDMKEKNKRRILVSISVPLMQPSNFKILYNNILLHQNKLLLQLKLRYTLNLQQKQKTPPSESHWFFKK